MPKPRKKFGRPTKFEDRFVAQAEKLCLRGATDAEIADFFEVSVRTIQRWRHEHEDFCRASNEARAVADARVERSLYERAMGFEHDAVKIFMPANAKEPVYAPYREKVPPDTTACIFWLKNRKQEEWRDRSVGEKDNPLHVKSSAHTMSEEELLAIAAGKFRVKPESTGG